VLAISGLCLLLRLSWKLPKALAKGADLFVIGTKMRWFEEPKSTILSLDDIPAEMLNTLNSKKEVLGRDGYDFIGAVLDDLNELDIEVKMTQFIFSTQMKKALYILIIMETDGLRQDDATLIFATKKGLSVETGMSKECSRFINSKVQKVRNFTFRVIPVQKHFHQFEQNHLSYLNNRFSPNELTTFQTIEQVLECHAEIFRNHNDLIKESGFRFSSLLFFNSLTYNPFRKALQHAIYKITFKKLKAAYPDIVFRR